MDTGKTICVTGAAGRLGTVVLERLAEEPGVARIVALDKVPPRFSSARVTFHECDVRDGSIGRHFTGADAVVHLAFIVERGARDATLVDSVNVGGSENVFRQARRAGCRQVVYASSIAAYGFHPENRHSELTEDAPLRGDENDFYYSRTKAQVEHWLDAFEEEAGDMAICRIRPSVFLGQKGYGELKMLRRRVFPYVSGEAHPVHVTHEEDVAEAFALALQKGVRGAFNIATSDPLPTREWARQMGKRGVKIPAAVLKGAELAYRARLFDMDPSWWTVGGAHPIVVSSKKARRELGWRPRYDTTGAVLRALAGAPTAMASPGVRMFLGTAAAVTRFRGSLPLPDDAKAEMKGFAGSVNLAFTGEHPSEWHVSFGPGHIGVHRGFDPHARATAIMKEETFLDLLTGKLQYSRATMTGRIRYQGDSAYGMFPVGGLVAGFRKMLRSEGRRRLPERLFARMVLKRSGRNPDEGRTS